MSTDFARQKLYAELIRALSTFGISQKVYVPVRTQAEVDQNRDNSIPRVEWKFSYILTLYMKFNFYRKLTVTERDLKKHLPLADVELIHAHFLFSDGGLALNLFHKHQIPYVVSVRNTDLNTFFKYALHLRKVGIEILLNARKIIFVTPAYRQQLLAYVPRVHHDEILSKSLVIPNGINDFWLRNKLHKPMQQPGDKWRVLYVGEFSRNKNIEALITTVVHLNREGAHQLQLTLVGEYGDNVDKIRKLSEKHHTCVQTIPKMTDKQALLNIYRDHHIFAMVSFKETFGLVYIEALTQKLPVLYSRDQGIDGYFKEGEVGYSANASRPDEIKSALKRIIENYHNFESTDFELSPFHWQNIAERYVEVYKKCIEAPPRNESQY